MSAVLIGQPPVPLLHGRRRRWPWIALAIVLILVIGGAITAASVAFRYAHAAPLSCACGLEWSQNEHVTSSTAGPYHALIADARPGSAQSFYVLVQNRTAVTQTILGLQYPDNGTAEPVDLAVAIPSRTPLEAQQDYPDHRFTTASTAIPPEDIRWLRITIHTAAAANWGKGRQEYWTDLRLRVRVGWFERDETISLDNSVFVLRGT